MASACGILIGYERESAFKVAGIRTHLIVAISSAILTCVSMYGFQLSQYAPDMLSFDPSRIAAGIVTGVGFLGAGAILVRSNTVSGLTTAAGLWAVSGIGIAIGTGMYTLGICATLIIFTAEWLSHTKFYKRITPSPHILVITVEQPCGDFPNYIAAILEKHGIRHARFALEAYSPNKTLRYKMRIHIHKNENFDLLLEDIKKYKQLKKIIIHEPRFSNN